MSGELRECDWCGKQAACEDVEEQAVCGDCAVWLCGKCGTTVHAGDYHCGNCDGCGDCCGCEDDDEEV
jgi:hypothetical protein